MKNKLMNLIKYFKVFYSVYFWLGSALFRLLGLFVRQDEKLILFNSFGGRKFDDSTKAIYMAMLKDGRFKDYRKVWAFHEPGKYRLKYADKVKTDTPAYFLTALKARCWISNSSIERGLDLRRKGTFYFNTWHGTTIKKMGSDIGSANESFKPKAGFNYDIMCSQGDYDTEIFSRAFSLPRSRFLCCGLPRNDLYASYTPEYAEGIKRRLGLPEGKKVILYCPTFREYDRDEEKNCVLAPPMDLKKWAEELGGEYCLLFRAHYEVSKVMDIKEDGFVFNMSSYEPLEDLMIAADLLISDYSSVFFDFSIMDKPMLHFTYDYERYARERGMYFDIRDWLDGSPDEDGVIALLKDGTDRTGRTRAFREHFVNYYGSAVKQSLDCIYSNIGGQRKA